jgi:hypothetical protein
MTFAVVVAATLGAFAVSVPAEVLKTEPAMGRLKENQRVLVDDGSCPAGQIMEVIGGNHQKVGGTKLIERRKKCIPRR